jgi:hypothetical protein
MSGGQFAVGCAPGAQPEAGEPRLRIIAVDDHPVIRAGVRALLTGEADMEVVGDASNGEDAIACS